MSGLFNINAIIIGSNNFWSDYLVEVGIVDFFSFWSLKFGLGNDVYQLSQSLFKHFILNRTTEMVKNPIPPIALKNV